MEREGRHFRRRVFKARRRRRPGESIGEFIPLSAGPNDHERKGVVFPESSRLDENERREPPDEEEGWRMHASRVARPETQRSFFFSSENDAQEQLNPEPLRRGERDSAAGQGSVQDQVRGHLSADERFRERIGGHRNRHSSRREHEEPDSSRGSGKSDLICISRRLAELKSAGEAAHTRFRDLSVHLRKIRSGLKVINGDKKAVEKSISDQKKIILDAQRRLRKFESQLAKKLSEKEKWILREKMSLGRLGEIQEEIKSIQEEDDSLTHRWDEYQLKIRTKDLDSLNYWDVEILLSETGLHSFLPRLTECGVITNNQLGMIDDKFFRDMKMTKDFSLGERQRLLFHLKYIKEKHKMYDPSLDSTFRAWSVNDVLCWLIKVNRPDITNYFEKMKICGIALSNVTQETLVSEILEISHEEEFAKRRDLRISIEDGLWAKIVNLREVNGYNSVQDLKNGNSSKDVEQLNEEVASLRMHEGPPLTPGGVSLAEGENSDEKDDPPQQFLCPITQELMEDPVTCKDGSTYERTAVEEWIDRHGTSPLTREPLSKAEVFPNRALKEIIQAYREKKK